MTFGILSGPVQGGGRIPLRRWMPFLLVLLLFLPGLPAGAWEDDGGNGGDGENRWGAARLSVTEGSVYVLPDGAREWEESEGNVSLAEGDRVSVPDDAGATLSFRGQTAVLHGGADLSVVYLRDEGASYRLSEGRVGFRLDDYDFLPARVSFPSGGKVRMTAPGYYRISIGEEDEAVVRVPRGEAVVSDPDGDKVKIRTGQQAFVGENVRVSRYDEPPPAEPDHAPLSDEERRVEAPPTVVYELRDYGDWVFVSDFGYCWRPHVVVGWSPFVYGSWSWSFAFGWNWVSYEPWGWYPYHCGRWFQDPRRGWVWIPRGAFAPVRFGGTRYYRPVTYYPATVRMVREGERLRWVPLAPRERFVRPVIGREDVQAYRYVRPLPAGTVFARGRERGDEGRPGAWRPVEPPRGRSEMRPRDDRPAFRIGDPAMPFRGDRAVEPRRGATPPGSQGRPAAPGRERVRPPGGERREPQVIPPPGRRGLEPPGRIREEGGGRGGRLPAPGDRTGAKPPPVRERRETVPAPPPPPQRGGGVPRGDSSVAPPVPAQEPRGASTAPGREGRPPAPSGRAIREPGRPEPPAAGRAVERGGDRGERRPAPGRDDRGGGRSPDDDAGRGGGLRGR